MIYSYLGLAVAAILYGCTAGHASPLTVLNTVGDGAFTFTLTTANLSVNTGDFWTDTYYVPPAAKSKPVAVYSTPSLGSVLETDAFVPFTVLVTNATAVTGDLLRQLVATYLEDDVFTTEFLKGASA